MNRIYKSMIVSLAILLASGCASVKMVEKNIASKISSVAVITVVAQDAMYGTNLTNQQHSTIAKDHVQSLTNKSISIISDELNNIRGWKVKQPDSYAETPAYQAFNQAINKIWEQNKYAKTVTPYNNTMARPPVGIVLFAGDKIKASLEEYKKICTTLGVDAVAIASVSYKYKKTTRLVGTSIAEPVVILSIEVIDKDGNTAIRHTPVTAESRDALAITTVFGSSHHTFDDNPQAAYIETLESAAKKLVKIINMNL
ncbi:MAG: hypothetical protein OEY36_12155 [Gammaproteobacteria bacterium]|nr:hypothetical protein [Gammaproteobacteria bacterium]